MTKTASLTALPSFFPVTSPTAQMTGSGTTLPSATGTFAFPSQRQTPAQTGTSSETPAVTQTGQMGSTPTGIIQLPSASRTVLASAFQSAQPTVPLFNTPSSAQTPVPPTAVPTVTLVVVSKGGQLTADLFVFLLICLLPLFLLVN